MTQSETSGSFRGRRSRLRGMMTGRAGKAVGISSLAAPVIGFVINDLRKPDSLIRGLVTTVARKLLPDRTTRPEVIDVTNDVEVLDSKTRTDTSS